MLRRAAGLAADHMKTYLLAMPTALCDSKALLLQRDRTGGSAICSERRKEVKRRTDAGGVGNAVGAAGQDVGHPQQLLKALVGAAVPVHKCRLCERQQQRQHTLQSVEHVLLCCNVLR